MTAGQGSLFRPGPVKRKIGRARRGLDQTLNAMRAGGLLENVDAALVALCRVAADELDAAILDPEESRFTKSNLIGRYHSTLSHLIARSDGDDDNGDVDALFAALDNEA
jgi:hypothetical protein